MPATTSLSLHVGSGLNGLLFLVFLAGTAARSIAADAARLWDAFQESLAQPSGFSLTDRPTAN